MIERKFKPDDLIVYINPETKQSQRVKFRKYIDAGRAFACVERPKDFVVLIVKSKDLTF